MKTYTIWSYGNLFTCTQTETGIRITNNKENSGMAEDEHIGDMDGITLPAEDEHPDTVAGFEIEVFSWLEENYWDKQPVQTQFEIEDVVNGFRVQGTIHEDVEDSHRCEVWVYDSKERISRVRMCGQSMLHVIQAATAEAINRLAKISS